MIGQVLQRVGQQRDVLWFWFVPYVTLVAQTLDALLQQAADLRPVPLAQGRNQEVAAGTVLISTAQGVARAQRRTQGYDADGDDDVRTLAALLARARAKGLRLGWWWMRRILRWTRAPSWQVCPLVAGPIICCWPRPRPKTSG